MKGCAGFWVGMSAGLLAGAAMGMMSPYGRDPMKTCLLYTSPSPRD